MAAGKEPQHRLEENTGRKGSEKCDRVGVHIRYFVLCRGRKMGGSEGRVSAVTWFLFLLFMGTVRGNRPPRFVMEGNSGSEIVVRMREGEGGRGKRVTR